jgi:hypothetical protein
VGIIKKKNKPMKISRGTKREKIVAHIWEYGINTLKNICTTKDTIL